MTVELIAGIVLGDPWEITVLTISACRKYTTAMAIAMSLAAASTAYSQSTKATKVVPRSQRGEGLSPTALSGIASSARHCIGPDGANVHHIGWVPNGTQLDISFSSDFDPVASATLMQLGEGAPDQLSRTSFVSDDDSGGNLEPELRFTTSFPGTVVLHVAKFSASREAGCYFYKVEVRTP